jgi:ubiquinone biosynthesis protein
MGRRAPRSAGRRAGRLRPRLVIANFKRWTAREVDLRREAASASELADAMHAFPGYRVPGIDWDRTNGRVMTLDWIDGVKISNLEAIDAAGHDRKEMASRLVLAFLTQAISGGYFHADMHQGNLFVEADGTITAIDFGIMGRIDRQARQWLAEILYGLTTGDYARGRNPFRGAIRAELSLGRRIRHGPARGGRADARAPGQDLSVGQMLDGLLPSPAISTCRPSRTCCCCKRRWSWSRDRPAARSRHQHVETAAPFVRNWIRDELGPEAAIAQRVQDDAATLLRVPALIRRIEERSRPRAARPSTAPAACGPDVGAQASWRRSARHELDRPAARRRAGRRRRAGAPGLGPSPS